MLLGRETNLALGSRLRAPCEEGNNVMLFMTVASAVLVITSNRGAVIDKQVFPSMASCATAREAFFAQMKPATPLKPGEVSFSMYNAICVPRSR